jgi:hypothetical protein
MIATDQDTPIREAGADVVPKDRGEGGGRRTKRTPRLEVGRPADTAQTHDDPDAAQKPQFLEQVSLAGGQLFAGRLVQGRGTAGGRGDVRVAQLQRIIAPLGDRTAGEPRLVQGAEQPRSALVTGEHPTRAVSAVGSRGQPHQQEPRSRISEPRQGPGPVVFISVAWRRICRDGLTMSDETRTATAPNDARVEKREGPSMLRAPRL